MQLPRDLVEHLAERAAQGDFLEVDLPSRSVSAGGAVIAEFKIEAADAEAMLNGWDETQRILESEGDAIAAFERHHKQDQPWLFSQGDIS